jgi:PAS domain-containing protein
MPAPAAPTLRIAVIGLSGEEVGWTSQLAGRGVEVVVVHDVRSLSTSDAQLGVVFATPEKVSELVPQITGQAHPPLAVFVDPGLGADSAHKVSLLRILLSGKREWERTFDAILDPIMVLNEGGVVIRTNLQLARALGRTIQSVHGEAYSALLGPSVAGTGDRFAPEASDPIAESLADGLPRHAETRYGRLPGMHEVTVSPVGDREEGLVVILKDVSERRDHQERMQRSNRLSDIGQLAAGIAHEINTPLASIALRAESLMKAGEDPQLLAIYPQTTRI